MVTVIRKTLKYVLPVAVIALAMVSARVITSNKPEPRTRDSGVSLVLVDATRLSATSYPVVIRSQGNVQPTRANTLVPAVAGTVVSISDNFVAGGAFRAGDLLLQIDPQDYEIALRQAVANLSQVDAQLHEERARADQARAEWRSMGRPGQPSPLTLREPQLEAAAANRDAAQAQVEQAELELARTRVIAPYDGVVSEREVDLGQFVARGAPVGSIHSISSVDVRLPLSNRQLTYLQIPTGEPSATVDTPNVELRANIGTEEQLWTGSLIRAEGIDAATQQLNVIARIENPYTQSARPLRVGQFVHALIEGELLQNVFVVPREALREEREVLVIDENNELQRRQVSIAWADEQVAAVNAGLAEGDLLVLTPLSTVSNGTPVRATIDGVVPAPQEG